MKAQTITVSIAAAPERIYRFAGDPRNLPRWVPSFCQAVECVDGQWIVTSPIGRVAFAFAPDNAFGVLDHTLTLPSGETLTNPMRVVPNGAGGEMLFTLFQREGMSDAQFAADAALVQSDLQALRELLESAAA